LSDGLIDRQNNQNQEKNREGEREIKKKSGNLKKIRIKIARNTNK